MQRSNIQKKTGKNQHVKATSHEEPLLGTILKEN